LCRYCCRIVTSETQTAERRGGTLCALTIAGSDSGGGAGIQADLKAFARCGVHGTCAITAITAQSTVGVSAIHPVPPEIVLAQVRAVLGDIGVGAVKVGMLGTVEVTLAVAQALDELPAGTPVVVDPVMVAESGARLLQADAQRALIEEILPRATVVTPNLPEARTLADAFAPLTSASGGASASVSSGSARVEGGERSVGQTHPRDGKADAHDPEDGEADARDPEDGEADARDPEDGKADARDPEDGEADAHALARAVLALGPRIVVLTGGHREQASDLFLDSQGDARVVEIPGVRHPDGAAHGSGCTHSSVLAAQLALGRTPLQAARTARELAGLAVAAGLRDVGAGAGPVDILGLSSRRSS
jgi:hydroxymethylpyrimidine/phosphomethylpyrimidine kinase